MFKRSIFTIISTVIIGVVPGLASAAYPDQPIRMIIPFAPGGSTDILGRLLAEAMRPILGQAIVVENKPGAGGNIGGHFVATAKPDGYTVLLAAAGPTVINPSLYKNMNYSPSKDLLPVTALTREHNLMVVNPEIPAKNLKEFITYAKSHPQTISFGSPGAGSPAHLAGELLNKMAGLKMQHVPYKGSGPAISDLLANHINVMIDNMPPLLPHAVSGKLRALGVPSSKRSQALPNIQTFEEQGLNGYVIMAWKGLMVPKGTPGPIVRQLHDAAVQVLKRPDIRKRLTELGAEPEGNTPEAFAKQISDETRWWADMIKQTNVSVN